MELYLVRRHGILTSLLYNVMTWHIAKTHLDLMSVNVIEVMKEMESIHVNVSTTIIKSLEPNFKEDMKTCQGKAESQSLI